MTKSIYKYKVEYKADGVNVITYHSNAKQIKDMYNIPKSTLFVMINPNKPDVEKFRNYEITRCNEEIFEKITRTIPT